MHISDEHINNQQTTNNQHKMSFSPHDHLVKQGWRGKGTGTQIQTPSHSHLAFKNGHATRPIPVVQKRTMSGIGKDRDEAIPFWDQYVRTFYSADM